MPETKQINAIHRGVKVLKVLAQGINRLEDIYPRLGLSKSTTHRILISLTAAGLAFQDPVTRFYHLGPTLLELASNPQVSHHMLVACAQNELVRLNKLIQESALLMVACGLQRLVVKEVPSPLDISFSFKKGHSMPLHVGSSGKVLLSMMDDKAFEVVLRNLELVSLGPNTITEEGVLRKEIELIREQGYATSFGETQEGTAGVSMPVRNYTIPVTLCILGPEFRFTPTDHLEEIRKSARRISNNLKKIFDRAETNTD
jgi:IclR family acetate operon transcriptional repressor